MVDGDEGDRLDDMTMMNDGAAGVGDGGGSGLHDQGRGVDSVDNGGSVDSVDNGGSMHCVYHRGGMDRVDNRRGVHSLKHNRRRSDDWSGVHGVDGVDGGAVVHDLAGLGDGSLGADHGHGVDHRGGVDRDHSGLVGHQEAGGGGGASQDGGESNLLKEKHVNNLIDIFW